MKYFLQKKENLNTKQKNNKKGLKIYKDKWTLQSVNQYNNNKFITNRLSKESYPCLSYQIILLLLNRIHISIIIKVILQIKLRPNKNY